MRGADGTDYEVDGTDAIALRADLLAAVSEQRLFGWPLTSRRRPALLQPAARPT